MNQGSFSTGVEARDALAARLYPDAPAPLVDRAPNGAVQAVRDADPARTLYKPEGSGQLGKAAEGLAVSLMPEGSAPALAQAKVLLANVGADIGFNRDDMERLAVLAAQNTRKPPTEDELRTQQLDTIKAMRTKYGKDYDKAMAGAAALAKRDPRFENIIKGKRLGNDPWLLGRLAELSQSPSAQPRPKTTLITEAKP